MGSVISAAALAQQAISIETADARIGVVEQPIGSNRGADVDRYNRIAGAPPGSSWCASYQSARWLKAIAQLRGLDVMDNTLIGLRPDLPFLACASCGEIMEDAQRRGTWLSNAGSDQVEIKPGWLALFRWDGSACSPGARPEHIEMAIDAAASSLFTIGGNTRPDHGGPGTDSEGYGVFSRTRSYDSVVGFVRTW